MEITVRLFALCADMAGANQTTVSVEQAPTVGMVRKQLEQLFGEPLLARSLIAVNGEYTNDARVLRVSDEVALIPPVAGG